MQACSWLSLHGRSRAKRAKSVQHSIAAQGHCIEMAAYEIPTQSSMAIEYLCFPGPRTQIRITETTYDLPVVAEALNFYFWRLVCCASAVKPAACRTNRRTGVRVYSSIESVAQGPARLL
jgi:hypothetical protein